MKYPLAMWLRVPPLSALLLGMLLVSAPIAVHGAPELRVVASIKPMALLASEIVGAEGSVELAMSTGASPHHYALRVSDVRRLQAAHLVIWVGPELERFLVKPLAQVSTGRLLTLAELEALEWPSDFSSTLPGESHHSHTGRDPHLWLNPRNGAEIATVIAERLAQLAPAQADTFTQRAQRLAAQLLQRDAQLQQRFLALRDKGFVVYHDGYQHFVQAYGLRQLTAITITPEQPPGARHLYEVRQRLAEGSRCILVEPYYESRLAEELAAEFSLPLVLADPLGRDESTYLGLIDHIAEAFGNCLAKSDG